MVSTKLIVRCAFLAAVVITSAGIAGASPITWPFPTVPPPPPPGMAIAAVSTATQMLTVSTIAQNR